MKGSAESRGKRTLYYHERIILGPVACQGCGKEVVYTFRPAIDAGDQSSPPKHMGWLHPSGDLHCGKGDGRWYE